MRRYRLLLSLLALPLPACAARSAPAIGDAEVSANSGQARLEVVNRATADMDVYVEHGGQRSRLGLAPAGQTTRFSVGSAQFVGVGLVRFLALPIGGTGRSSSTEPIPVQRGQVLSLDVPPM